MYTKTLQPGYVPRLGSHINDDPGSSFEPVFPEML